MGKAFETSVRGGLATAPSTINQPTKNIESVGDVERFAAKVTKLMSKRFGSVMALSLIHI